VLAVRPPVADRPVRADDDRAVRRGDPHPGERRGQPIHRLQHAEAVENARRLRAQVLAADLRAREARAVEELHRDAVLGEQDRRRGARGPRAQSTRRTPNAAWPPPTSTATSASPPGTAATTRRISRNVSA